jgi:patatin-related protein
MSDPTTVHPRYDPTQEVRLAVVMYGGVSLAIYINGVAQELLALVRATAPAHAAHPDGTVARHALLTDRELRGAEGVYRKLGRLLAHGAGVAADATVPAGNAPIATRFVVDIVSGTSAGGINGVYLAKALANDQSMGELRTLWIEEGDIGRLVNDACSYRGLTGLPIHRLPRSLLNSARMYWKLLEALDGMGADPGGGAESPLVDELDLWVTTTDVRGLEVPLDLFDRVVTEKRYRKVFHFGYRNRLAGGGEPDRGTFRRRQNPILAFAARCTSAFPFAFEPMELADTDAVRSALAGGGPPPKDDPLWSRQFDEYAPPGHREAPDPSLYRQRAFADGGYLDNKPFSWAVDTLPRRRADLPVDRRLVYVDPDPGAAGVTPHPGRREAGAGDAPGTAADPRPDAIANVVAALTGIPRYEPIRADLARILERNRDAERLADIVAMIDRLLADAPDGGTRAALTDGVAYRAYLRLRVAAVADDLAELITALAGFEDESGEQSAIRCLVQAWLRGAGGDPALDRAWTERFLGRYDLAYRIRRINFVSRRASAELAAGGPDDGLRALKRTLGGALVNVRRGGRETRGDDRVRAAVVALQLTSENLRHILEGAATKEDSVERAAELLAADGRGRTMSDLTAAVADGLQPALTAADRTIDDAVAGLPDGSPVRRASDDFDLFDSIRYPIGYGNVGEIAPVEVVRISPQDATAIVDETEAGEHRRKLAGTRLGHFGGFFERDWRCNDLLWGRLDAAERIVAALVPEGSLRTALVDEAHLAILGDALGDPATLPHAGAGIRDPAEFRDRLASRPKARLSPIRTAAVAARMGIVAGTVIAVALGEKVVTDRRSRSRR